MYRVIEVADNLGVSKVTIYKKISHFKKELKPHIHKKRNVTYIDDEGVRFIRDSLVANQVIHDTALKDEQIQMISEKLEKSMDEIDSLNKALIEAQRMHIEDLQRSLRSLKDQVGNKRSMVEARRKQLADMQVVMAYNRERIKGLEKLIDEIQR